MFRNPVEKDLSNFRHFLAFSAITFLSEVFQRIIQQNCRPVLPIAVLKTSPRFYCQSFGRLGSISEQMFRQNFFTEHLGLKIYIPNKRL